MVIIIFLYFLIGLISSTLGAMAGLGGGVIIKPVLDFFGHYDLATIGFLSASTVFAMSATSLIRIRNTNIRLDKKNSLLIALGSIIGGILGKAVFNYVIINQQLTSIVGIFQSSILAILMICIYIFIKYKQHIHTFNIHHKSVIFLAGVVLGLLSAFLGIGGGPLNVAILTLLFSMNAKNAALNSLFIIFFAQLSSIILVLISTDMGSYDLSMLGYMIIGGILGGVIGSSLVIKLTIGMIEKIFHVTILVVLFINIYNIFQFVF